MSIPLTLARRELSSYFNSVIAYAFAIVFLVMAAIVFFVLNNFFTADESTMRPYFTWLPWLFAVLVPALTMRSWAEERKLRTDEVLLTLPCTSMQAVLGKFLAAFAMLVIVLFSTLTIPVTVELAGNPDWGPILGGYLGALLLGAAMISLGLFLSSGFNDQIVAFVVGLVVMLGMNSLSFDWVTQFIEQVRRLRWVRELSWWEHFQGIARGVIDTTDIVYFVSATALFLTLNAIVVEVRRR